MTPSKRILVHLGGLEQTHSFELDEPKTIEALALILIATGKFGDVKAEEIFIFEEDSDEELPRERYLTHERHGKRYHAHRCRQIKVTFIHVDEKREHIFRPGATIGKLLRWVIEHFSVDKGGKYTLRLTAEGDPLAHAVHIGSLVHGHPCELTLYFTPASRIQG